MATAQNVLIILIELCLHLSEMNISDLYYDRWPKFVSDQASSFFVVTVLCIFFKMRPYWPNALKRTHGNVMFIVETILMCYSAEFLVHTFWVPTTSLLHFISLCTAYVMRRVVPTNPISPYLIRNGSYVGKFTINFTAFMFMLYVTDPFGSLYRYFTGKSRTLKGGYGDCNSYQDPNNEKHVHWDASLPLVPLDYQWT